MFIWAPDSCFNTDSKKCEPIVRKCDYCPNTRSFSWNWVINKNIKRNHHSILICIHIMKID